MFANKTVFSIYNFSFTYALTFIHTLVTFGGMGLFRRYGVFEGRQEILGKDGVKVRSRGRRSQGEGLIVVGRWPFLNSSKDARFLSQPNHQRCRAL